jgi:hypothetical protein
MPSTAHQTLLLWIARKMVSDGFRLTGYDGPTPYGGAWNLLPPPFEIAGVRCDACGLASDTWEIGVGEAKTSDDLASEHTKRQLRVFGHLVHKESGAPCRLYIAVPRSAVYALDHALIKTNLIGARHIIRLHIPDAMLEEPTHVARRSAFRFIAPPAHRHAVPQRQ